MLIPASSTIRRSAPSITPGSASPATAAEIVQGAIPDGDLGLAGVNMRLCVEYAEAWLAAQEAQLIAA